MVLVVVPVHERGALVRYCFRSAAELELPAGSEILVIDDMSPTLDVPALIAETGLACRYERTAEWVGADRMVGRIWRQFLDSGHAHLLFLDSDMVANRDAVTVGLRLAARFDGLISLYNSIAHAGEAIDDELLAKRTVGNAATLWTRPLAALALETVDPATAGGVDHAYCRLFAARGIPIAVTARSRVQHIGIYGANNQYFGSLEHGSGFRPDSPVQWEALGFVYDDLMRRQQAYMPPALSLPRVRSLAGKVASRLARLFRA